MSSFVSDIATEGFAIVRGVVEPQAIESVVDRLPLVPSGGVRNAVASNRALASLAAHPGMIRLAASVLGERVILSRAILFDKTPDANWRVPWRQDTTIAVRHRVDVQGFGPWSVKDGVVHVKPPARVLEGVLTLRLHLDACDESNGPLWVLPGTHLHGFLDDERLRAFVSGVEPVSCAAAIGDVVAFRPLLLHSSPKSRRVSHRRVLHLEFAGGQPDARLEWHDEDQARTLSADR